MRGEDEKHATDTKTKGVVGHMGKITPIAPKPRKTKPMLGIKHFLKRKISLLSLMPIKTHY